MRLINFDETPSLMSEYMMQMRDREIQKDPMIFRTNRYRAAQIMA